MLFDLPRTKTGLVALFASSQLLVFPILMMAAWDELSQVQAAEFSRATWAEGVLALKAKKVILRAGGNIVMECPQGHCAYPDIAEDLGKNVVVGMANGWIVEVTSQGRVRNVQAAWAAHLRQKLFLYGGITVVALAAVLCSLWIGRKTRGSRTAT